MEELCPNAIMLNYTNPMAMNCRAMQRSTPTVAVSGLCHSVQGTADMLARWIGAPTSEIDYVCAGINHLAWFTEYLWKGEDAYPLLHKARRKKAVSTKSTRKPQRDVPGLRLLCDRVQRPQLRVQRLVPQAPGPDREVLPRCEREHRLESGASTPDILKHYLAREKSWQKDITAWADNDPAPLNLARGHEYAASIINAWLGGDAFQFNGNVPNTGLVTNLPEGCLRRDPGLRDLAACSTRSTSGRCRRSAALTNLQVKRSRRWPSGPPSTGDPLPRSTTPSPTTRSPQPCCPWPRSATWWTRCLRRMRGICRLSSKDVACCLQLAA